MGSISDSLASSLFGKTRQGILALLFTHDSESFYLRQVIRAVGLGQGTVQRELDHLTKAGLLVRVAKGHQVYYQANRQSPIFPELKSLMIKTAAVGDVLRSALKGLGDRVRLAFIYGSMATGKDKPASDLDLIVVGDLTFSELTSALHSAQEIIGREINPTVYPPSEFKKKLHMDHHFLTSVLKEPRIFLIGDDRELARLGQKRLAYGA